MTSEEFYEFGFNAQLKLIQQKGRYLYTEIYKNEEHNFYAFKHFIIDYRKWCKTNEASIHILEVKPSRQVLEHVDKMKMLKKSLAAFRKLSAAEQKKVLKKMRLEYNQ